MKILALDTSSSRASVAVAEDDRILDVRRFDAPRGRGAEVFAVLGEMRPQWLGIERLAVGIGPGAYNGLRAACALAGSFQLALGIDVVAVPSACILDVGDSRYTAVGDARGGRIYRAEILNRRLQGDIALLDHAEFQSSLQDGCGHPVFRIGTIPGADFLPSAFPDASILALVGRHLPPTDPRTMAPIYLKPPHITNPRPRLVGLEF
ncbi:MAG: tRNA (adenosine(37)-N6)-threonylcarbamoyltransferase complex dimerization subunit type 1 TsaB [Chthoniobacterales bacterium]|nr:tRNA (adenosine(37)-N6)-threonylcarbamoyltransferase complex dimerization subunit type 1 TsaB [Chthoniobacterales bacterium]